MKNLILFVTLATMIISLSACERAQQVIAPMERPESDRGGRPDTAGRRSTVTIGVTAPLSGPLSPTGVLIKEGFQLAVEEVNANPVSPIQFELIFEDDMGGPEGAVAAFNKLIHEDGVSLIIGPATSASAEAAFPIAGENGVVAISPTSSARGLSAISDFTFRVALAGNIVIAKGVEVTHAKLGYQRVATIYDEADPFSIDREATLQEIFAESGIEVVATEVYQTGATDFSAQLTRIQALNPDAVFVSALPPAKPHILLQRSELGITAPFIVSSITDIEIEAAGAAAEGAITFDISWLPTDDTPGNQAFVQNYTEAFGMPPNAFASVAYASVHILAEAIKNARSTDPVAVRDALANIYIADTILGEFTFDANGDAVYDPKVLIVRDGALEPLE